MNFLDVNFLEVVAQLLTELGQLVGLVIQWFSSTDIEPPN